MLIVNNGAPKTGTVWLHSILCHLLPYTPPEKHWWSPGWSGASVDPLKLADFLQTEDWQSRIMLFKAHYNQPPQVALLKRPGIVVVDCTRYLPDVVVSYYHHLKRRGLTTDDIDVWTADAGLRWAAQMVAYHRLWKNVAISTSYERLTLNGPAVVLDLAKAFGVQCSRQRAVQIVRRRSFDTMKSAIGEHARRGGIGTSREELPGSVFSQLDALDTYTNRALLERAISRAAALQTPAEAITSQN